jgi:hypothetical protein
MNPFVFTNEYPVRILRMPVEQQSAAEVRELFLDLSKQFFKGITEYIDFDPGYKLNDDECFKIDEFPIPDELFLVSGAPMTADNLAESDLTGESGPGIKAIIGYDFSAGKKELMFQAFDSKKIFKPGRGIFRFDKGVFKELKSPVVSIEQKLAGIWKDGTFYFTKLGTVRRIFDFEVYELQATEEQMTEFAKHSMIKCKDSAAMTKAASRWTRGKIARILKNQVLDNYRLSHLKSAAKAVNFDLPLKDKQIDLPSGGLQLKRLLQFLDDDMYRGPISDLQYLSSGKRELLK